MRKWYPVVVVAMSIIASAIAYPTLPDRIPTHWDNDRVWERTHRVGGRLFVGLGIVAAFATLLDSYVAILAVVGLAVAMSLGTVIYSYVAWRQETSR
jgi:uncharacterized membrane protein